MKKIQENPKLDTGYVKLYLGDILSIVDAMQEVNRDGELKITVGGYEFSDVDNVSELKQKEYQSMDIEYKITSPYSMFRFWVRKNSTHLSYYSSDASLALRGAFSNIERIILAGRRKLEWIEKFFYLAMSFGITASILLLQGQINQNPLLTNIGYSIAGVMLAALAMYLFTIPIRASKIILVDNVDHDTFWKRNKDTVIISAISGIISLLLGILGTLFVQSLGK